MSFNKRRYSKKLLLDIYIQSGEEGIEKIFKRVDAYFYDDDFSKRFTEEFFEGNRELALNMLKECI
jgi:hypothetical protein